jgi:hypothetical protein
MRAGSIAILGSGFFLLTTMASAQAPAPQLPPAPAALTVPNPIPPPHGPRDLYQLPDRSDRFQVLQPTPFFPSAPVVFVPGFLFGTSPYYVPSQPEEVSPVTRSRRVVASGGLWLETLPETAQVYVDGFYVGIVQDYGIRGRMLELAAGSHRIELRAPGYQTAIFDVIITPGQVVRYRGDLQPLTPPPPIGSARAVPKTVYVIPNCYAGDKPPSGALRAGCDVKKMRVRPPSG